jgi:phosphoadenosine phosphosulfate reductase
MSAAEPAALVDEAAARELEGAPAGEVLRWAADSFAPGRMALVSAFGPGSAILLHFMADAGVELPVVFIDTLHHFPETLQHVERVRVRYGLDLRVHRPAESLAHFEAEHGARLWERDLERYQRVSKVEPFQRAVAELDGWITGRRRDQAGSRADLPVVQAGERVRINPLAGWTREDVWGFIRRHGLPYNTLHDRGYTSIGDEPLTTPVAPGEHERSGRWRGLGKLECGIHIVDV